MWKCRETISLAWSVVTVSTFSMMPKSVL